MSNTSVGNCAAEKGSGRSPLLVEGVGAEPAPMPRARRDLRTLQQVRREMARCYRLVDRSLIPSDEGTRRIYMLAQIAKIIVQADFEARLLQLERIAYEGI